MSPALDGESVRVNCEQSRESLPAFALGQDSPELHAHLADCPDCQAELESVRRSLGALAAWSAAEPPPGLAERTLARIQAEPPVKSWWRRWLERCDEALQRFGAHRPTLISGFATLLISALLLGKVLSPNLWRGHSEAADVACQRNTEILREALRDYAARHGGRFPARLRELPVKKLPDCPDGGQLRYEVSSDASHFTLSCTAVHGR